MTRIVKDVSTMNYFVTVSKQRITGSLAMQNISNPKPAANLEKHLLHSVSVTEIFMDSKHVFTGYRGILEWVPSRSIDYLKNLAKTFSKGYGSIVCVLNLRTLGFDSE